MNELSPEAKELLAAASGVDDPSADDRARVKRAVLAAAAAGVVVASGTTAAAAGTSAGAATGTSAAAGSAAVGTSAAAGGAALGATATSGAVGTALGAKVLALFVVVGAGTAAVTRPWEEPARTNEVASATAEAEPRPQVAAVAQRPVVARAEVAEVVVAEVVEVAEVAEVADVAELEAVPEERATEVVRTASTSRPRVEAAIEVGADTLAAELTLLRRARAAQSAGDTADALAALAEHRERFPQGALRAEREGTSALLRCQSGPDPAVAASFARAYPSSPLLARVRTACGASSDSE